MYKYHCLNPIAQVGLNLFDSDFEKTTDITEAQGILVRSASMHEMEVPENLLCVARAGAGVNNIPLDELAAKGVVVFNTPGANANGVKELVIAGMLLASRDIIGGIEWAKENASNPEINKAAEKEKSKFAGCELEDKKLGIIGLGAIGVKVANAAKNLGMEVYGYDPYVSVKAAWNLSRDVKHVSNIDDLYKVCDYITIHVPLMDATKGMIDQEAISKMKKDVVILNFARDLLVNETDVLKGIENGIVKKYVTDFPNKTIAGNEGCIVIPHLGASTMESEDNCAKMAVNEMTNYLLYGNIENSVNYPNTDLGPCSCEGRIAIFHKNSPNMITKLTAVLGNAGINISDMSNKSKGDIAYTMIDTETKIDNSIVDLFTEIDGVLRVRLIK